MLLKCLHFVDGKGGIASGATGETIEEALQHGHFFLRPFVGVVLPFDAVARSTSSSCDTCRDLNNLGHE